MSDLADCIRTRFFPVAFLYAHTILRRRFSGEELYDRSAELAQKGINDQLHRLAAGEFNFAGRSKYSSYLYGILVKMVNARVKTPVPIMRKGFPAHEVYQMAFGGWSDREILSEMVFNRGAQEAAVKKAIADTRKYLAEKSPKEYDADITLESYDAILEEPALGREPGTRSSALDDVIHAETYEALHDAIDSLNDTERQLIEDHFFMEQPLKEIGARLCITNPVYEKNKALQKMGSSLRDRLPE